jgi:hypothetical protein
MWNEVLTDEEEMEENDLGRRNEFLQLARSFKLFYQELFKSVFMFT